MADAAPSELLSRRHQMFAVLTDAEIARVHPFGTVRRFRRGDSLFTVGRPSPGMFVVLKSTVAVSHRDGHRRASASAFCTLVATEKRSTELARPCIYRIADTGGQCVERSR